jgi:hypothetical protein
VAEEPASFPCPYLNGAVEMTAERERHIAEHHPDLLPSRRERIAETLADPDEVRSSSQMSSALLFSKRYEDALTGKSVVVVVMTAKEANDRNWVITAYATRKLVKGDTKWKKN